MSSEHQCAQALGHDPQVEQGFHASDSGYRRLFETAKEGILILEADTGRISDVNPFLVELLDFSRSEMLGKTLGDSISFKNSGLNKAMLERLQHDGNIRCQELTLETREGGRITVEFAGDAYQVGGKKMIQCRFRDITELKDAEDEIRRLKADLEQRAAKHAAQRRESRRKLQVLSRRLVEAQETERRNIARELHDEIGQALTVMQLNLQALLQASDTADLKPRLNETLQEVERVLEQVQDLALNLRPSMLDDLGLGPALTWMTSRQAALAGLKGEVQADVLEHRLDSAIETECFRVAQEALTNVVRHAQAHAVTVDLHVKDGQLHLHVRDDGVGFEVAAVREKAVHGASLGLLSMEERAALVGGGLEFTSLSRQGTEVHAWFPLKWQAAKN